WELSDDGDASTVDFLREHELDIVKVVPLPGSRMLTSRRDGSVLLWDLHSQPSPKATEAKPGIAPVHFAEVSADGHWLLTAGRDWASLWDLTRGGEPARFWPVALRGHEKGVTLAAFTPDVRRLITAGEGLDCARLWNLNAAAALDGYVFARGVLTAY